MQDPIRDDKGRIIGYVEPMENQIRYRHVSGGLVGYYDISRRQYNRVKRELGSSTPLSHDDYGRSDVISYEVLLKAKK